MNLSKIKTYYKSKFEIHGATAEGMDWKNKESQYLRFDVLSKFIDFDDSPSILDVGCGSSEFYNHCILNNKSCRYQGLDIMEEMIKSSNDRFGSETAVLGDLDSKLLNDSYDYVIASGTFNAKLDVSNEEWELFFLDNLKKMFDKSTKGIIFNCMTEHVDWTYDRLYYPNLSNLTKYINSNFSKNFIIDHSYDLFEMTIFVSK